MNAIVKITLRSSLLRLEMIILLITGIFIILPSWMIYLNDNLSSQILSMISASSAGGQELHRDIFLSAMFLLSEFFTLLVAVFIIPALINRDIQSNVLYIFLARPVPRWKYFLGKYIGGSLSLFIFFSIMTLFILAAALIQSPGITSTLLKAAFFGLLKLAIFSALLIGLSSRFPAIAGTIFALFIYIAGHFPLPVWSDQAPSWFGSLLNTTDYILPDLYRVWSGSIISAALDDMPIELSYVYWFAKNILIYIPVFLLAGFTRFNKMEL